MIAVYSDGSKIAKAPGISEGRARQIRKKLDDHPKTRGQEYRDEKRQELPQE